MEKKEKQAIINESLAEFAHVMMWRRYLHMHPELSFEEYRTSKFIAEILTHDEIGFSSIAGTGILAKVEGTMKVPGRGKDAVVLRADMDALPITETVDVDFASVNKGVMHACGHDMHTAILLGAMRILQHHRDQFCGTVFGLFQPGEELNPGGATMVLREDPFAGYNIVGFIGEHVEPAMQTGTFGFRKGKYMASSDELRFTVRGTGGHAALRDKIKDPVKASVKFMNDLYGIPLKNPDKELPTIIAIGTIRAEGATNVIPREVYMEGTMRTFDEQWRAQVKEMIAEKAEAVAQKYGVEIDISISEGYPSVYNDEKLTGIVQEATQTLFGDEAVRELCLRPTSEDFGFYSKIYPSVFYRLGVGGTGEFFENHEAGRVHTPCFKPDEKALGYGVVQFVNVVFTLLGGGNE